MNENKFFSLLVLSAIALIGLVLFFQFGAFSAQTLWAWSDEGRWLLPLVLIAALLDSVNPCAFSILILTIAFLFSLGKLRGSILWIGGAYILGIFAAYMFIGLGLLQVLHLFSTPHFMAKIGALLLVLLGSINLINVYFPAFPIKLRIPHLAHEKIALLMERASLPSAFILGALVGLCEFPCTGGPYLMVLGLLHDKQTYLSGLGYLLIYNLIFVLPLAVILLISGNKAMLGKVSEWQKAERINMRLWGGIAMVALGIIVFFI